MKITRTVLSDVVNALSDSTCEKGGVLGRTGDVIEHFYFDESGRGDDLCYQPSAKDLNRLLEEWCCKGIDFAGMIHSHTKGKPVLSPQDLSYAEELFSKNNLDKLYFPLVCKVSGQWSIFAFSYDGKWTEEPLEIIEDRIT